MSSSNSLKLTVIGIGAMIIFIAIGMSFIIKKKSSLKKTKKIKATLVQKQQVTHDSIRLTFVPSKPQKKGLFLNIGQHIQIQAIIQNQLVKRKYTPVSRADQPGAFKLLIKVYKKCQQFPKGGIMSQYLDSLNINDQIDLVYPYGRLNYLGDKIVSIRELSNAKNIIKKKYDTFYMIAGGTGITPIYQIIQYITQHEIEQKQKDLSSIPQIILIFANKSEDDILLKKELEGYAKKNPNLKLNFCIDRITKKDQEWKGFVGYLDQQKINKTLPQSQEKLKSTLFLSCGPFIMCNIVQKIWMGKKIPVNQIYRF